MLLLTEGMQPRLFGLDFQLIADSCLMIIAIFVLFLFMSYFLWNPAKKYLEARKKHIEDELARAAADEKKAAELKEEYEARMKQADAEAEKVLADAHKRGIENEKQIVKRAHEEADRIVEHASREAELEKQKVADDVKKEMVVLASMIAGKVVSASIDTKVQDKLVDDALKEIGESTWQN